jgi:type IV secretory pathway TraG/TraD family ATPase VirD4
MLAGNLVTGTTGSGKTHGVLKTWIRQLLALCADQPNEKAGALIIDPKNELVSIVRDSLACCGRQGDLVCIGTDKNDATWNPIGDPKLSPAQITRMILSASTVLGQESRMGRGERFWELQDRSLLAALAALARHANAELLIPPPITFGQLHQLRARLSQADGDLLKWVAGVSKTISAAEVVPLIEFASLPNNTRACVVASCGSLLEPFCRRPLCGVVEPNPQRREADLRSVFESGKVVLLNTSHAETAVELLPAQVLLASEWARLVLARPRLGGNQTRLVWTIIDEAARVITSYGDPASDIMDMARASRVGVIIALQNLAALHAMGNSSAVHRLASLSANHFFLSNTDPITAAVAATSLGSAYEYQLHRTVAPSWAPPLLFPKKASKANVSAVGVMVPALRPVLPPEKLARLKPGEIYFRISTGEIGHVRADLPAP